MTRQLGNYALTNVRMGSAPQARTGRVIPATRFPALMFYRSDPPKSRGVQQNIRWHPCHISTVSQLTHRRKYLYFLNPLADLSIASGIMWPHHSATDASSENVNADIVELSLSCKLKNYSNDLVRSRHVHSAGAADIIFVSGSLSAPPCNWQIAALTAQL